jgi:hypothetical protein
LIRSVGYAQLHVFGRMDDRLVLSGCANTPHASCLRFMRLPRDGSDVSSIHSLCNIWPTGSLSSRSILAHSLRVVDFPSGRALHPSFNCVVLCSTFFPLRFFLDKYFVRLPVSISSLCHHFDSSSLSLFWRQWCLLCPPQSVEEGFRNDPSRSQGN